MGGLTTSKFDCGCVAWRNEAGLMHRLDGPACDNKKCTWSIRHANGYYLNGHAFVKGDWVKEVERIKQELHEKIQQALIACMAWCIVQGNKEKVEELSALEKRWWSIGGCIAYPRHTWTSMREGYDYVRELPISRV